MSRTSVPERGVIARGLALLGLAMLRRAAPPAALQPVRRRGHALPAEGGRDRLHRRHHGHPRRPDRRRRRHPDQARRFDGDPDDRGGRQVLLLGHRARQLPGRRGPRHPAQGLRAAPAGRGRPPRSRRRAQGRQRRARQELRRHAHRPRRRLRRQHEQVGRVPPVQRQRHPARPAAGPGQRRPQPDLRHHRDLELRARRAGDPGRHARLLPDQRARHQPVAGWTCSWSSCVASAAGSRTASCGNRYEGEGWA